MTSRTYQTLNPCTEFVYTVHPRIVGGKIDPQRLCGKCTAPRNDHTPAALAGSALHTLEHIARNNTGESPPNAIFLAAHIIEVIKQFVNDELPAIREVLMEHLTRQPAAHRGERSEPDTRDETVLAILNSRREVSAQYLEDRAARDEWVPLSAKYARHIAMLVRGAR